MKKSPAKQNPSALKAVSNAAPVDADFASLRQEIKNRVGQEALDMVEATIEAVNNGQYAALKYLFEAVGLFPADVQSESQPQDALASTLLHELRLAEIPDAKLAVTKDSARS